MQNYISTTIGLPDSPLPMRRLMRAEEDPGAALATATSAFAALVLRYTREEAVTIVISSGGDGSSREVRLTAASLDETLAGVRERVRAQLGGALRATSRARLRWSEAGAELSITVRLADMAIEREASHERGIFATNEPLVAVARHFRAVHRALTEDRSLTLRDVSLLDAAERSRVLDDLSASEIAPELETPGLLHHIFEQRARETPDHDAVLEGCTSVTYAVLDSRAERLANGLQARGIGPGSLVALLLPRSIELYVALLGVLKAGAAYVPLDTEYPRDRIESILADCGVGVLLTTSSLEGPRPPPGCLTVALDEDWEKLLPSSMASPRRMPSPTDLAYVIYTSGSTGKPKGVAVEHRSVVHLVRVEQRLFGVLPSDRVFQGFSIAFDAAVEEVWLAFAAGATLVCGTKEVILTDLPGYLTDMGVTVLSTVPTLLASIEAELPTIRLVIVGGEACPQALAERWATPACAMFNTYGPTEATVIATYARLSPGRPVTIGRPLPNYRCYITDRTGTAAPAGVAGEICIAGVGLARGYLGRADLTAERFVPCPFAGEAEAPPLLYRTGDLGRFDESGNIEFLGRIDEQIKLRGFRIELGEIETALLSCSGVTGAAATVREDAAGQTSIVAYIVASAREPVSDQSLELQLGAVLPPYMIPAQFERLDALPTLTSGKVDKRALPAPSQRTPNASAAGPRGPLEETIGRCWSELFAVPMPPRDTDFFRGLGGHSLLAAQMVSRLRREPSLAGLSIRDVYEHPTIASLAARHACVVAAPPNAPASESAELAGPSAAAVRACGVIQLFGLYGLFGVYSIQWLAPYLSYAAARASDASVTAALACAAAALFAAEPALLFAAVMAKWLVIGRYVPGRYPLWGSYYIRFWLVDRLVAMAPTAFLVGTPWLGAYYRLLGARVGSNVHLASDNLRCFDLVLIGDDATIGIDAAIAGYAIEDGTLVIGRVKVGARCVVGARSVLSIDTTLEEDATLDELSMLTPGTAIPAGEHWAGSPAHRAPGADRLHHVDRSVPIARPGRWRRIALSATYLVAALLMPAFVVTAFLPGLVMLSAFEGRMGAASLIASPLVAASFIVLLCLEIALLKWVVLGRVRSGRHDLWSGFVLRKWIFDRAMAVSLDVLGGLYATLFLNPWLRLLGMRVGRNAEVSTASSFVPDLAHVGDDAFVADCVSLGTPRIGRGQMDLEVTRVGVRAFIGNSAVVAAGVAVGNDCLVGCLSSAPRDAKESTQIGASWFGSPPIAIPQRQVSTAFPAAATFRPTRKLVAQRLAIEALRVTLPTTCFVALTCLLLDGATALHARLPLAVFLGTFPLLYAAFGVVAALIVIAMKWTVIGRYRAGERPLWSTFVWRTELVTAMHENLADPFFNELLRGTPFAAWFFRALGAKIGRGVYMGTTRLTEYDLITVGDGACLNDECTLQTHLFEDRVMKVSSVTIGDRCSVGAESVILYDTQMEPRSRLAPLSLMMKGETLPSCSRWEGSPARPAR